MIKKIIPPSGAKSMVQLWLLETEQGNLVMLHPFYAIEQEVDTTVQRILAAHPDESFRKVRRMERGFTIHFTYLPPVLEQLEH